MSENCLVCKKYFRLPLYDRAVLTFADFPKRPLTATEAEIQQCNVRELVRRGWLKQVGSVDSVACYSLTGAGREKATALRFSFDPDKS